MCNVTAWLHYETARSLANDHSGGGAEGEFPENCSVSYLSFVYGSNGRVCGRSLTAGKILFTGRQTCSFYLVLWLWFLRTEIYSYDILRIEGKYKTILILLLQGSNNWVWPDLPNQTLPKEIFWWGIKCGKQLAISIKRVSRLHGIQSIFVIFFLIRFQCPIFLLLKCGIRLFIKWATTFYYVLKYLSHSDVCII